MTNVCYNALDRHVKAGNGDRVAIYWEGNDEGVQSQTTYKELLDMTCRQAAAPEMHCTGTHMAMQPVPGLGCTSACLVWSCTDCTALPATGSPTT